MKYLTITVIILIIGFGACKKTETDKEPSKQNEFSEQSENKPSDKNEDKPSDKGEDKSSDQSENKVEPISKMMYVNAESGIRRRAEPSIASIKIGAYSHGERIQLIEKNSTPVTIDGITDYWYKTTAGFNFDGKFYKYSWVFGGYLSENKPEIKQAQIKQSQASRPEDFKYAIMSEDYIIITLYQGKDKNVVIPEQIKGYPVREIRNEAFKGKGLTSVIIPDSVRIIGDSAFEDNKLTSVIISNSLRVIGDRVFCNNQLTGVIIPNSIKTIDKFAFHSNRLTSIVIPNSVEEILYSAFAYNQLTSVTLGNSVRTIGSDVFMGNQLTGITIPNSVRTINNGVFRENKITNIIVPNSVSTLGPQAFDDHVTITRR